MTGEQYRKANKVVVTTLLIILGYIAGTLALAVMVGNHRPVVLIQLSVLIIAIVLEVVCYKRFGDSRKGEVGLQAIATIAYGIVMVLNEVRTTWLYTLPILLMALVYIDLKQVVIQNVLLAVINVLRIFIVGDLSNKGYQSEAFMIILILILLAVGTIKTTKLLQAFNAENVQGIENAMKITKENNQKIQDAADQLVEYFTNAMQKVEKLNKGVESSSAEMEHIARSTESTAQAVQMQSNMCIQIEESTNKAREHSVDMKNVSKGVMEHVAEGAQEIQKLMEQARMVEKAGNEAVDVIQQLTRRVENVQGFVGTILEISSQTNLLSLNASIEAARAGEAGKGFAVVADEIRQLSEQTKDASNSITEIIQELNEETGLANQKIHHSVTAMMEQNKLIEATGKCFEQIDERANKLSISVDKTGGEINQILKAATAISENLVDLSATSQQVAAASNSGMQNAEVTAENMEECKQILEEIYRVAKTLSE